ncbi:LysR substrate-binding domain-containing protein [Arthrobacter sp. I2-34]|uniref:LysR substrate-binding domain-containing protein n=1 Tax=Arthrobacter hankyongi TaxID=2904801 RepID=A0ABS9L5S6_9MICC|nr:LysR substrate-binding domain-containing protein [Arthrobacter hankyongi]MCG2622024.1 LysR substrate-binding domain-containing protein [Arthrobacter hankyongi]
METRHLRYFVAVAEERHFGRAAARLHMAQPPLSQQIKQLEERLGTRLLSRSTRKVELTAAGELLLERGRRILEDLDSLESDVAQVGAGVRGVLRVGFTGSATYRLMPQIVREAKEKVPGLLLNVQGEMLTPQLVAALEDHSLDVAVLRPPVRSAGLELKFLKHDELVVALPDDSPWAESGILSLEQLAGEPFVSYPMDSAVTGIFLDACRKTGFFPRIVQEAKETSTLLSFVAAGAGMALIPATTRTFAIRGTVFRPLRDAPVVDLAVAWRADDRSPLLANFISLLDSVSQPAKDLNQ